MNRYEVIMTIKKAGNGLSNVMDALYGEDFAAGYRRATVDMVRMFNEAPINPDFEAEREAMLNQIGRLKAKTAELEREVCNQNATIQKLLSHVDVSEVLGVRPKKKSNRRGVAVIFSQGVKP